jgi:hypothetical protein
LIDRLKLWASRHKLASVVIALVALFTLIGAIANAGSGPQAANGPTTSAATSPPTTSPPSSPTTATVPRVLGLSLHTAQSRVEEAGFIVTVTTRPSHAEPGTVLNISPSAGSTLAVGETVSITVAQPIPRVPNVVGLSQAKATARLKAAGYKVTVKKQESSQPVGMVLSTSPPAGSERLSGRTVTIVVAKPVPSPPPSPSCTPGYSPCLVSHGGADYDCAGGSGDGPYYTEPGVTYRVTGSDPYGLDADGDGYGCE